MAAQSGSEYSFPRGDIRDNRPDHEATILDYERHVYGKTEVGGTQVLYLSGVPHEKLGLPKLSSFSPVRLSEGLQHTIYQWMMLPAAAVAVLAGIVLRNRGRKDGEDA